MLFVSDVLPQLLLMLQVFSQYFAHLADIIQLIRKIKAVRAITTNRTLKKTTRAEMKLPAMIVIAFATMTAITDATLEIITVLPNLHTHFVIVLLPKQGNKRSISIITNKAAEMIAKAVNTGRIFGINSK